MLCKFAAFNQGLFILLSHQMPLKNLSRNQALIPLHLAFESPECNDKGNYSILLRNVGKTSFLWTRGFFSELRASITNFSADIRIGFLYCSYVSLLFDENINFLINQRCFVVQGLSNSCIPSSYYSVY